MRGYDEPCGRIHSENALGILNVLNVFAICDLTGSVHGASWSCEQTITAFDLAQGNSVKSKAVSYLRPLPELLMSLALTVISRFLWPLSS